MARIMLEYNARSKTANRIIDVIMAMDNVFKIKDYDRQSNASVTRKAIQDAERGDVITCESYDDYLKHTAEYA